MQAPSLSDFDRAGSYHTYKGKSIKVDLAGSKFLSEWSKNGLGQFQNAGPRGAGVRA